MCRLVILLVIGRVVVLCRSCQVVNQVVRQAADPCCSFCLSRLQRQQTQFA